MLGCCLYTLFCLVAGGFQLESQTNFGELYASERHKNVGALSLQRSEHAEETLKHLSEKDLTRRQVAATSIGVASSIFSSVKANAADLNTSNMLRKVTDPATYSALVYAPPNNKDKLPLLVILHGAGKNDQDVWALADPQGEHAGLVPSLLATNRAPAELSEIFCVVAPYAQGKRSFYEEPRSKLLSFVNWVCSEEGRAVGCPNNVDPDKVCLFGFSDGATVAVELATTRRFRACVIAAYGFTGTLPALALQRLDHVPIWVFHSADDVIFPVSASDRLIESLRSVNNDPNMVKYTRYDKDQEGFTGSVRGHSTGISASKLPDIYNWMLSFL